MVKKEGKSSSLLSRSQAQGVGDKSTHFFSWAQVSSPLPLWPLYLKVDRCSHEWPRWAMKRGQDLWYDIVSPLSHSGRQGKATIFPPIRGGGKDSILDCVPHMCRGNSGHPVASPQASAAFSSFAVRDAIDLTFVAKCIAACKPRSGKVRFLATLWSWQVSKTCSIAMAMLARSVLDKSVSTDFEVRRLSWGLI